MTRALRRRLSVLLLAAALLTVPACASGAAADAQTAPQAGPFSDVPEDAWYAGAVLALYERGVMNGTGGDRFSPDGTFTRAQLAAVLYRMAGEPAVTGEDSFSDTAADAWYSDAVVWAERSGVVNGVGGGRFAPDEPVTQEQLVTMLYRMAHEPDAPCAPDATPYAARAVGWAREHGLAPETADYTFAPQEIALRAQVAEILCRSLALQESAVREEIVLTVAGQTLTVVWAENSSVDALRELLRQGELTLEMSDYGGFEKGAPLPQTLPQNNEQMHTDAGDVILYQGRQFVIYYDVNSWSLTPLGRITGLDKAELRALLGSGSVTAVLSLRTEG